MGCSSSKKEADELVISGPELIQHPSLSKCPTLRMPTSRMMSGRLSNSSTDELDMRRSGWANKEDSEVSMLLADRAAAHNLHGISDHIETTQVAYFADVALLKRFLRVAPELLLLPWEYMRAMGALRVLDPRRAVFTFFSHQWQSQPHPFPDLLQISEHLNAIETPYMWCDWYCVPQWSRKPGCASTILHLFEQTMSSFHVPPP